MFLLHYWRYTDFVGQERNQSYLGPGVESMFVKCTPIAEGVKMILRREVMGISLSEYPMSRREID